MPGSTPATSQLDWLSSTTAMIVLSWSKATRDLLKSFSWGIGALRQLFASDDGAISFAACPIPSLRWREMDSNHRYRIRNNPFWLPPFGPAIRLPQQKPALSCRGPMVRIPLPPRGVGCEPDFRDPAPQKSVVRLVVAAPYLARVPGRSGRAEGPALYVRVVRLAPTSPPVRGRSARSGRKDISRR